MRKDHYIKTFAPYFHCGEENQHRKIEREKNHTDKRNDELMLYGPQIRIICFCLLLSKKNFETKIIKIQERKSTKSVSCLDFRFLYFPFKFLNTKHRIMERTKNIL